MRIIFVAFLKMFFVYTVACVFPKTVVDLSGGLAVVERLAFGTDDVVNDTE